MMSYCKAFWQPYMTYYDQESELGKTRLNLKVTDRKGP